jgi:hypothetical protein
MSTRSNRSEGDAASPGLNIDVLEESRFFNSSPSPLAAGEMFDR